MNPKPAMADAGGGVLSGLVDKPKRQGSFLMTMRDHEQIRAGKTPPGYSRNERGEIRPMVQGGRDEPVLRGRRPRGQ